MFITFEGIEGAGKSTAIASVADGLERRGRRVLLTQEPGGCALGKTLRTLLLDQKSVIASRAELFLFLADRAQTLRWPTRAMPGGVIPRSCASSALRLRGGSFRT